MRLRGDAIADAQAPAGLVVLQAEARERSWIDAEGMVWAGASNGNDAFAHGADVMTLALRLREPHGLGELRAGRFVFTSGAIRPVQIDGVAVLARAPQGSTFEAAAGAPVVPQFGARAYDWMVATRAAQRVATLTVGASYLQRRDYGEIADHEIGGDALWLPSERVDVMARAAYDLSSPGLVDAIASGGYRGDDLRVEIFATHRSPSRLLPATSLFAVLGDFPSDMGGSTVTWKAAPRLDVVGSLAAQSVGGTVGENAFLRSRLLLNDRGDRSFAIELRRQDVSSAQWSGVRAISAQPIAGPLHASWELEVAAPDQPNGRGSLWPWGLLALGWRSSAGWDAAAAVEASSTPEHRYFATALVRVSTALEAR